MRVVVAGGGVAGAEALLALRELAGDRVELTLVSTTDQLVLPPLSVAEPFAQGQAPRHPLEPLLARTGARLIRGTLSSLDAARAFITLSDGERVDFDALLIATGARPVARLPHATTWWPGADQRAEFSGLLRDLEEGYIRRVAFVVPPGPAWPLPLYELALMTAEQAYSMGIDSAELAVITPEAIPLSLFGEAATTALELELREAGIELETATVVRIERHGGTWLVLQPTTRRRQVDRVIALPGLRGPAIAGTSYDGDGFILVDRHGQMRGSESVWAAGDATAGLIKFGGMAAYQADVAAREIAQRAGVRTAGPAPRLELTGALLTGGPARSLRTSRTIARRLWEPSGKVFGTRLTPFLTSPEASRSSTAHG